MRWNYKTMEGTLTPDPRRNQTRMTLPDPPRQPQDTTKKEPWEWYALLEKLDNEREAARRSA